MILADTNVVSEFMKDKPDPSVLAWAQNIEPVSVTISVVTVEEVERGLGLLPDCRRRRNLEQRWATLVDGYGDMIAVYDVRAARAAASILVAARAAGRPMGLADAQIAGVCLAGAHVLASRNVEDFSTVTGLTVINPFE